MSARVNKAARGKEGVFGVDVNDDSTYTLVGAIQNIDYTRSAGSEVYECREERTEDYDGTHESGATLTGFVFYRTTLEQANHVDARNFEAWMASETVIKGQLKGLKAGDVTRTGDMIITEFSEGQPQEGRQTFNVTLKFVTGKPTLGVVPTV